MIRPSLLALATDSAAWDSLCEPLTVRELQRLAWLQSRIAAAMLLQTNHGTYGTREIRRFAWAKWLVQSGRVQETL